jgi:hypothetical protein
MPDPHSCGEEIDDQVSASLYFGSITDRQEETHDVSMRERI